MTQLFKSKYKATLRMATNNNKKHMSPEILRYLVLKTIFLPNAKIFVKHI